MYKNATFKEKFEDLQEWIPYLINAVKKDLKNDHLKKDFQFTKKYLPGANINKVTSEQLAEVYQKAIREEEGGEGIAEFIASRWILKNSELLQFFEQELTRINPDYSEIDEITDEQAKGIIEISVNEYGAPHTYLFSVLNSVFFPESHFKSLKVKANDQQAEEKMQAIQGEEEWTVEQLELNFERKIARLTDKYEKKIGGLQKKYVTDTEALKKQVAQLQRKLQEKAS